MVVLSSNLLIEEHEDLMKNGTRKNGIKAIIRLRLHAHQVCK